MKDFEKISKMSLTELVNYIIHEFHEPIRKDLLKVREYGFKMTQTCLKPNTNFNLILELFNQFELEMINHINNEENIYFQNIIKLEENKLEEINSLKKFLHIQEIEHNEIDNYLIGGKSIINDLCLPDNEAYEALKEIVEKIYKDTLDHVYIENNFLNTKVKNFINEVEKIK